MKNSTLFRRKDTLSYKCFDKVDVAGTYVTLVSLFNMLGRFAWSSLSDYVGRKNTYHIFFVLGTALYCTIPTLAAWGTKQATQTHN